MLAPMLQDTLARLPSGSVWHASRLAEGPGTSLPTGFAALDDVLPGKGWPAGALIELLVEHPGTGELSLLLPLMRNTGSSCWLAWVAPPLRPYTPALAAAGITLGQILLVEPQRPQEALWATRQVTASGSCDLVLAWIKHADNAALRRLQLAAEQSGTPLFLVRPRSVANQSSPAVLRLGLSWAGTLLAVHLLKRRGPPLHAPLLLAAHRFSGISPGHTPAHPARCPPPRPSLALVR